MFISSGGISRSVADLRRRDGLRFLGDGLGLLAVGGLLPSGGAVVPGGFAIG